MEDYSETGWRRVLRNLARGIGYLSIFPRPRRYNLRNKPYSGNRSTPEQEVDEAWKEVGKNLEDAIEKFRTENLLS